MEDELLPCPFCGKQPEMFKRTNVTAGNGWWTIDCCSSMTAGFILDGYTKRRADSEAWTKSQLIKKWNKRV